MSLIASKLPSEISFYNKNGIKILTRGDNSRLPEKAQKAIKKKLKMKTKRQMTT